MDYLNDCDVTWNSPSSDSSGSMPLGNGDIGLNLWVEKNGDLLFYLSKSDAWDENGRLVKIGRVRVSIDPNPFRAGISFEQTLHLRSGEITINADAVALRVWADANHPVVHVEIDSANAVNVRVTAELWRTAPRTLAGKEIEWGQEGGPTPLVVAPDTRLPADFETIYWVHQNTSSIWPQTMQLQGLADGARGQTDPLLQRIFGAAIEGKGFRSDGDASLVTASPQVKPRLSVHCLTTLGGELSEWTRAIHQQIAATNQTQIADAYAAHRSWWNEFWNRSWIIVTGDKAANDVTRGYARQRFITACAGRGAYPIKFNGSLFTVDVKEGDEQFDGDYRRWGGGYWFQNTRLAYWPMLAAGDFEMIRPLFKMYLDALPLAKERTRTYFDHAGACYLESLHFWGTYLNSDYGWDRTGKAAGEIRNPYMRNYFSGALELLTLMLEHDRYCSPGNFVETTLLPMADAILTFYDNHYSRVNGKLRIEPALSLETWHTAVDPLPEIAGLHAVLDGLLQLPGEKLGAERSADWTRLKGELAAIPTRRGADFAKANYLIPAVIYDDMRNYENPELYAVFPYRLYGIGKPDLEIGRRTFERREYKKTGGWFQDAIHAALLGLADEAKAMVVQNLTTSHEKSRFPAFWGPNYDWVPDQDHGGVAMIALQFMILQCDGERIHVLPAWPAGWDVEFKLHAPRQTIIEGEFSGGEMKKLAITPDARKAHIIAQ